MPLDYLNRDGYVVKITESAFIDMCLSALEAYAVREANLDADGPVETYGLVWGTETRMVSGATLYTVQKVSIDTSAERTPGACAGSQDALALKTDFINSFAPNLEFLGDFHTHPFINMFRTVRDNALFEFSDADRNHVEKSGIFDGLPYRLGLVMTVSNVRNPGSQKIACKMPDDDFSVLEVQFSNYRIWLQAYECHLAPSGNLKLGKKNVQLEVPPIHGLNCMFAPFGHYDAKRGEHIIEGYNDGPDEEDGDAPSTLVPATENRVKAFFRAIHAAFAENCDRIAAFSESRFKENYANESFPVYRMPFTDGDGEEPAVYLIWSSDADGEKMLSLHVEGMRHNLPQKHCEALIAKHCPRGGRFGYFQSGRHVFVYHASYPCPSSNMKEGVPPELVKDFNLLLARAAKAEKELREMA